MKLEHQFTMRGEIDPPIMVGPGPKGVRAIFKVTGGTAEGERINGKVLPLGADWGRITPEGDWVFLDVRIAIETDDGAFIHLEYEGHLEMNEGVAAALAGGEETQFGEQYFVTQPRLETGDERYGWVNRKAFVGEGRGGAGFVEYRVYSVEND
jgi:hypothetical protein